MKTKFIKKLSFVLVVAMVLSLLVPAAGVFASSGAKLNSTNKYLHLGRIDEGENEFNFNIDGKKKTWKYFWESANEDVAVVNEKNGVVTAVGVGKTKVTVYITDADGEEVDNLVANVTVRDNIKEVKISNPVEKLAVGVEKDYNRSFVTESGSTKKTDSITRWTVTPNTATIDEKGVFVATAAGEYEVTASSFQSKARYNAWKDDAVKYADYVLDSDTTKVTVAGSMVSAKQADKDTVNVTFDSAMTDVDKNISVYQLVGTTEVKQTIAKVEMDDAKKVAAVSLYVPFAKGSTFVVKYTGMDSVSFTAATTKVEDVASLVVDTKTVEVNKPTNLAVKLFNAEGVDISDPDLLNRVTFKSTNEVGTFLNTNVSPVQLTIFTKGVSTTVTATFHTYKYNTVTGTEEGNVEGAGLITAVDADARNITGLKAWTIVNDGNPKFYDVKQKLAVGDTSYRLFVEFNTKKGTTDGTSNSKDSGDNAEAAKYDYKSSDESVLIISKSGNVYPVKEGSVTVVVLYGDEGSRTPIGTIAINVSPKRVASALTLDTYSFSLSNDADGGVNDSKQVEIKLKDQLGDDFSYTSYNVEKLSGPTGVAVTTTGNGLAYVDGKITFTGTAATKGDYAFKITVEKLSVVVTVSILDAGTDTASAHRLQLSSNSIDIAASSGKTNKDITIELFGLSNKGVKVTKEAFGGTSNFKIDIDAPYANANDDWDVVDSALVDATSPVAKYNTSTNKYMLSEAVSGGAMVKAPTGSYTVTAYEHKDTNNDSVLDTWVVVDRQYFAVTDSQKKPVVAEVKSRVFTDAVSNMSDTTNILKAVKECFKFTLDGSEVTSIQSATVVGNENAFNVVDVTIRQTIDNTWIDHKISVGYTINKK